MQAFLPTGDATSLVKLAEIPEPTLEADEALIAVEAFSINRGETLLLERPAQRWRPGKDIAGRVLRGAANGSGPREGARVVAHPPSAGWAERAAVKTSQIAELPEAVMAVTAAALPLAGLTALRLVRAAGPVASLRLLITGASGGVGHYFTELAANAGADVTAVTATLERGERLLALGARAVMQDVADAQGPFDIVLELVGGACLQRALMTLKPRGTLVWFGQASRAPVTLDFFGFWAGPVSGAIRHFDYTDSDIPDGRDLETLVDLVAGGRLHPEIGLTADWHETSQVLGRLRGREVRGNAVLTIGSPADRPSA